VSLRVNISYSIELEDVPSEVSRILVECEGSLREIHGDLDRAIGKDPLSVIEELDDLRKRLAKLDMKFGDSMSILSGYIQTMAAKPEMEQQAMAPKAEEEDVDEEV
jgi:hypothetical protein